MIVGRVLFRRLTMAVGVVALAGSAFAQTPAAQPPDPLTFQVDVIASTPLPGVELTLDKMPSPVQTAIARDIEAAGSLNLPDFLNRRLNGVYVNEVQGNPFQADVNYRGYTASPLLGTPQGLSIFMDGVRLNQPFGEVVSWDLIPQMAIASMTLMPGSNPLFGLNTLGGALAIQTKDGKSSAGTTLQASYGSNLRRAIELEHGGSNSRGWNWYVAGNLFAEDGWRQHSPSDVRQFFGRIDWSGARARLDLSSSLADTALTGNGVQDQRLLDRAYTSVYTSPDDTNNRAGLVNLGWQFRKNPLLIVSSNAYFRGIGTRTLNGDVNEASLDQALYQPNLAERNALAAAGYSGVPAGGASAANTPFPSWRCIASALLHEAAAEECNALLNRTATSQHTAGGGGQVTRFASLGRVRHQLTAGGAVDRSAVAFQQSSELGYLNADRTVTGVGAFGDGVTGGSVDGVPYDTRVALDGTIQTWSAYATDTITAGPLNVTVSGRFNRVAIENRDALHPGGEPASLDGHYTFARLNPALGATYTAARGVNVYSGYSEGNRAPTSIELGCANPAEPCKLPNAMAGDPPLDQVITRTFESGIRGGTDSGARLSWNAGLFVTRNTNDILFVAAPETGFGYFKNFGATRRQGLELSINRRLDRVRVGGGYTWLSATYQSAETVIGTGNSTNDAASRGDKGLEGAIAIVAGNTIPLVPRHSLKAFADIDLTSRVSIDLDLIAVSGSFARGNENNQHQPDGIYYLGAGTIPGYAVVNLGGHLRFTKRLQIVIGVTNLLDRRYSTAAQLGPAALTATGIFTARSLPASHGEFPVPQTTFAAPGAPRRAWVGARIHL